MGVETFFNEGNLSRDVARAIHSAITKLRSYVDGLFTTLATSRALDPQGIVGTPVSLTSTAYTNATTTETDITGLSITLTLDTTRWYLARFSGRFGGGDEDIMTIRFVEGATDRKAALWALEVTGTTVEHSWLFQPAASGSVTIKMKAARVSGAGTVAGAASATSPMQFWIEDLGAA